MSSLADCLRRLLPALFAALLLGSGLQAQETRVILLRHAERQSLWDEDSPLSEAGKQQAKLLVQRMERYHPAALYASDRLRTRQTMAPLAAALKMEIQVRDRESGADLAAELLKAHRGESILICWHHDRMKQVAKALGVKGPIPAWSLFDYGKYWVIFVPEHGEPTLKECPLGEAVAVP